MSIASSATRVVRVSRRRAITGITVSGFKSIHDEQNIEIKPLTILAGSNSSGKSSVMQPLLLIKQTMESNYDPGPLLMNGPNVRFTSASQFFSRESAKKYSDQFYIGVYLDKDTNLTTYFNRKTNKGINVYKTEFNNRNGSYTIESDMNSNKLYENMSGFYKSQFDKMKKDEVNDGSIDLSYVRNRCFLELAIQANEYILSFPRNIANTGISMADIIGQIRNIIHVPGLRGNPERSYPVTAVGPSFPGTFETYVASIIARWQEQDHDKINNLGRYLEILGLTWKVEAKPINDTQVELQVGRLIHPVRGGARDLVNIADVGFSVSQTLPVLVALISAQPGQLIYIEQPELHLHPRAQVSLANILSDAAKRGVRVVVETHSSLLLLSIQAAVAAGMLSSEQVRLHWFTRRDNGATDISSAELDASGAFGDWPEDFADTELEVQSRYLDAAELQQKVNYDVS